MKQPLTKHVCMDKDCGWQEKSHKILDGIRCPNCDGLVMSSIPKKQTTVISELENKSFVWVNPTHDSLVEFICDVSEIPKELLTDEQEKQIELQYEAFTKMWGLNTPR